MKIRLILALVIISLLASSSAEAKYSGGTGEPNDPYIIATAENMNEIGSNWSDWDAHFLLVADINLADYTGTQFHLIGDFDPWNSGPIEPFSGVFDGNGHTISKFTYTTTDIDYIGLFVWVDGPNAEIKNLTLNDSNITVTGYPYCTGCLVALLDGTISNCALEDGSVSGYLGVGGMVGENEGTISSCSSTASVLGHSCVGGLVGYDDDGTTQDCYVMGSVVGRMDVGGLVGYNDFGMISNCYAKGNFSDYSSVSSVGGLVGYNYCGTISNCYATGLVSGRGRYTGGLAGINEEGTISNCYATVVVDGCYSSGGLVGENEGTILNCYATGSVSGPKAGGLVGVNHGTILNCYSTGTVWYTWGSGLVGEGGGVSNSFWDIETSGQPESEGGTGKTTAEMQDINTFLNAGWDFVNETTNGTYDYWQMPDGGGYPILCGLSVYTPPELNGSGTEENPYIIADSNDLGTIWYRPSAHYVLVNDINLAGTNWYTTVAPELNAVLDGNGFCIQNLSINGGACLGLFSCIRFGGEVKNLGLENCMVSGYRDVGSLAGLNEGTIKNCYATGSVKKTISPSAYFPSERVGGLTGSHLLGTISNCYSTCDVIGDYDVGGLVGDSSMGTISNCYAAGAVSGVDSTGGLMGYTWGGTISNCYASGAVSGESDTGGLVGYGGANVVNSFWDVNTTGQTWSDGGEGKTTAEMKTRSTFTDVGWDFVGETINGPNDVWRMCVDGVNYPLLSWQFIGDFICPDGVDILDLAFFVERWLNSNCNLLDNNFCNCTDINRDEIVNFQDFALFASYWLEEN